MYECAGGVVSALHARYMRECENRTQTGLSNMDSLLIASNPGQKRSAAVTHEPGHRRDTFRCYRSRRRRFTRFAQLIHAVRGYRPSGDFRLAAMP